MRNRTLKQGNSFFMKADAHVPGLLPLEDAQQGGELSLGIIHYEARLARLGPFVSKENQHQAQTCAAGTRRPEGNMTMLQPEQLHGTGRRFLPTAFHYSS